MSACFLPLSGATTIGLQLRPVILGLIGGGILAARSVRCWRRASRQGR
jgi:hypothetical protein